MTGSRSSIHDLMFSRRYPEALELCERRMSMNPGDLAARGNRARLRLCVGQLDGALEDELVMDADDRSRPALRSAIYLSRIGTLHWLMGQRKAAVEQFLGAVRGIRDGSVKYADQAGGVDQGLLCYFAAVSMSNASAAFEARSFLTSLSGRKRIESWPGPLALYVLDGLPAASLLENVFGSDDVSSAVALARRDLLKRRELTQTLFYLGIVARSLGEMKRGNAFLEARCELENPIVESEWYLSHHELGRRWY